EGDRIHVRIARGTDMAVRVIAHGEAPPVVELRSSDGRAVPATFVPPNEYVARFHSVRAPFSFHAEGGDDRDATPSVDVETVVPPGLGRITVTLTPPPYSGQPESVRDGGSFEALAGTHARLRVDTTVPVAHGLLRFRDADATVDLVADPTAPAAPGTSALAAEIEVTKSVRYSIEVEDSQGLRNSDSGTYSIVALVDRPPEVRLQAPGRGDVDVAPNGSIALQARVADDFAVADVHLRTRVGSGEPETTPLGAHADGAASKPASAPDERPPSFGKLAVVRHRLEIERTTAPDGGEGRRPLREGDVLELSVEALDARTPQPGSGESARVRAIVLGPAEIRSRLDARIARVKDTVEKLHALQVERRRRVNEILEALGSEGSPTSERLSIAGVVAGQNRVTTDARSLAREMFEVFESVASNRLDRIGAPVSAALDDLRATMRVADEDPYHPEVARALVLAMRDGKLGAPEALSVLGDMLFEAAAIALESSPKASKELDAAAIALERAPAVAALEKARARQEATIESLEKLLTMLSEWDTFQTVVTATHEIVDQQRALLRRTKDEARDRK
ncbi:MAG TPA: hypothetical protein VKE69_07585, partial [Planctomycetota bacterium]|nr:hypothetical protein [Planctomycetota bacterium]